ncbi:hypothetical protein PoB_003893000 [Plakobranchus ocellatus]|uniref:Uncharacterized protein n=1 Tax=Plakobranchus ocellatus TaxID=259542 RepID=A0AAV4AYQ9_9GAST|nr:hypothetical protein PoB_003893000 [Plakobranchus ocellatus]
MEYLTSCTKDVRMFSDGFTRYSEAFGIILRESWCFVPDEESAIVDIPDGKSAVITLKFGPVRTKGQRKGQDRSSRFAMKKKLAKKLFLERLLLLIRVICVVFVETWRLLGSFVNGMIDWEDCDF